MKYPKEVKEALKECILNHIWPKEDIISFLQKHGCTKDDLSPIRKFNDLTRAKMVHLVFRQSAWRKDEGWSQFNSMNSALLNWKNYNQLKIKKLNMEESGKIHC